MPTEIACPQCGNLLKVRPEYLGNRLRCPNCNTLFRPEERPPLNLDVEPTLQPEEEVLTLEVAEEEAVVLTLDAEEEPPLVEFVAVPELPQPPPPLPKRFVLNLDGPPQPKPPFIVVFQWSGLTWHQFRLYFQPEELRAVFVGLPLSSGEENDPKARKRREDRLRAIDVTTYADLLKDHRHNFAVDLDDVTEASLGPCGGWYRLRHRPPPETSLLRLWHRRLGRIDLEIRDPKDAERLREFLPASLGRRLKVR